MKNLKLRKKYIIEITIKTGDLEINQAFCLADYETADEWIKAAKSWISTGVEPK